MDWRAMLSRLDPRSDGSSAGEVDPANGAEQSAVAPVDQAISEGLMIAISAVVMAVKNRIIVRALRNGKPFDPDVATTFVKEELRRIADEQRRNDEHVLTVRASAAQKRKAARHQHDYGKGDLAALTRRDQVYVALAEQLDDLRHDQAFVADLAEKARSHAWDDVSVEVESRLQRAADEREKDADYDNERDERMRVIREVDLFMLRTATNRH